MQKNNRPRRWLQLLILAAVLLFGGTGAVTSMQENQTADSKTAATEAETAETAKKSNTQTTESQTSEETKKSAEDSKSSETEKPESTESAEDETPDLTFRNQKLLDQHYEKHGIEMGFDSAEEYEKAAAQVVKNKKALHKTEKEDGDDIYYVEETNEFVVVSTDGYIRTYFLPSRGIAYYNNQ